MMYVVVTCPITKQTLFVSDVMPRLLKRDAKGDWGYSDKPEQALKLTEYQLRHCLAYMREVGRKPQCFPDLGVLTR